MSNRIYIIGMGPGREEMMTGEAIAALEQADGIVGYTVYVKLLGERFAGKKLLTTSMRQETERCELCFREAEAGNQVALICSGDAGIYGLASLMYELGAKHPETELLVIPGITAASSGAAVLGAPLNHDFCVISLSDLMTPWEKIEKRLRAAAVGDFAMAIYNPSSHRRKDYLQRACDILLETIEGKRPCGYVENIGREGTRAVTCTLRELRDREVSICKLHLTVGAVVYDIGSGTGSVAVEIAGLSETVHVYAVERKPEAVELLRKNREHFHMDNMEIIEALAPEGLEELPVPTHAFIGGSGGRLMDILQTLYRKNPHMRIVINAISMETIAELQEVLEAFPVEDEEILQMQVNRVKKLGSYHLPQAENPVWICSFTFREGETGSMDKVKKALLTEEENGNRENGEVQR